MSDDKQPHSEVITSEKPQSKKNLKLPDLLLIWRKNKVFRSSSTVGALVILLVLGIFSWNSQQDLRKSKLDAMSTAIDGLSPLQKSQYYSDQGEYRLAEKIWSDEFSNTKDTQSKLEIYLRQSAIAIKFKKYSDAKKYANQAVLLAPKSSDSYVNLAQLSQAQGDIASAKKYWQQAIGLLDKKLPEYNLVLRDYQIKLDKLK